MSQSVGSVRLEVWHDASKDASVPEHPDGLHNGTINILQMLRDLSGKHLMENPVPKGEAVTEVGHHIDLQEKI